MAEGKNEKVDMANFDWQKLEQEIRADSTGKVYNETDKDKWDRKLSENPMIPIGTAVTTGILVLGLVSFATKRTKYSQHLMRARVAAQGFTIFALIGKYFLLCNCASFLTNDDLKNFVMVKYRAVTFKKRANSGPVFHHV